MSSLVGNQNTSNVDGSTGVQTFAMGSFNLGSLLGIDVRVVCEISVLCKNNTVAHVTSVTDSEGLTWHKAASADTDTINQPGGLSGAPLALEVSIWYTDNFIDSTLVTPTAYEITVNTDNDIDSVWVTSARHRFIDPTNPLDANISFPASALQMSGSSAIVSVTGISSDTANIQVTTVFGSTGPGQRPNQSGDCSVDGVTSSDYGQSDTFHLNQNYHIFSAFVHDRTSQLASATIAARDAVNNVLMLSVAFTQDATGTDGNASGTLSTATASLLAGTGYIAVDGAASGVTVTSTASVPISGTALDATEIDGNFIYEMSFNTISNQRYQDADYYSIFSIGDRVRNGLINAIRFGAGAADFIVPAGAFDTNYAHALGSGWVPQAQNPQPYGGMYLDFGPNKVTIAAIKCIGSNQYNAAAQHDDFTMKVGFDATSILPTSYAKEFDVFRPGQLAFDTPLNMYYTEFITTPRTPAEWSFFEFAYFPIPTVTHSDMFAEELELKIFHSILDGGDRRTTNGNPNKRTAFSMSADWAFNGPSGHLVNPVSALFDGSILRGNSPNGTSNTDYSIVGAPSTYNPVSTVGAYFQFVFPRIVIPLHMVFQIENREVFDSGGDPTIYGKWHWEYSLNGGISYTPIGTSWWFKENCDYMLAPNSGETFGLKGDLTLGDGATHWRMVLDEGPAFGNNACYEILFNLHDIGDQTVAFEANFSDDVDDALPVVTITSLSPFVVYFTDGTDDKLTYTLTNIPNPLLSAFFTDESTMTFRASFEPSTYVQTVVVMTGKT